MKLVIASDIHGSAYYCRKLLERVEKEQPDRLVFLVDILYHGPRNDLPKDYAPKEVIAMLNPLKEKILCVRGNCDTEVDQMVLEFPILADYGFLYEKGRMIFLTHGHVFNEKNLPMLGKGDILLHGHTHVPAYTIIENKYIINPGSVMMNRSSYGFGTFAIVTIINDELEIKYYHSSTFEECTDLVLNDGILMLEEFKKILK